jgi:hypothetical protein
MGRRDTDKRAERKRGRRFEPAPEWSKRKIKRKRKI